MTADREHTSRAWKHSVGDDDLDFDGVRPAEPLPGFDPYDSAVRAARFRRFLDDLSGAGGHFRESQRHLLLGLGEIARVASQHLSELEQNSPAARVAGGTTALIHGVLELAAARIPPMEPEGDLRIEARLEALANLRALFQAEAERYEDNGDHKLKRQTILAIVDAITQEMERVARQAPPTEKPKSRRTRTGKAEKVNIHAAPENFS